MSQYKEIGLTDEAWRAFCQKYYAFYFDLDRNSSAVNDLTIFDMPNDPVLDDNAFDILEKFFYGEWKTSSDNGYPAGTLTLKYDISQLRSQVAPDRAKLLAEAQSQLDTDIAQYAFKKGEHPDNLLEVILDAEGKLDSGNGSYNAHIGPTGCVDIKIYDENVEQVAGYATIGGYHEMQTSAEKQLSKFFCAVYADAYKEVTHSTNKTEIASANIDQSFQLDTKV